MTDEIGQARKANEKIEDNDMGYLHLLLFLDQKNQKLIKKYSAIYMKYACNGRDRNEQ